MKEQRIGQSLASFCMLMRDTDGSSSHWRHCAVGKEAKHNEIVCKWFASGAMCLEGARYCVVGATSQRNSRYLTWVRLRRLSDTPTNSVFKSVAFVPAVQGLRTKCRDSSSASIRCSKTRPFVPTIPESQWQQPAGVVA
eukprot:4420641-Amphidinium_carterae.1